MARFIRFEPDPTPYNGKPHWWIINKRAGDRLGAICWYPQWRQYIAEFDEATVWSRDCLADVQAFMAGLETRQTAPQGENREQKKRLDV